MFNSADNKDWKKFKTCFDSEIIVNTGKEPKNLTPQQMTDMWGKGMKNLSTVHQVSNFVVKIDELKADVFCYAIALTYKEDPTGENTRTMVGSYDFQLIKDKIWKISQIQFNMKFMFGNQDL